MRLLYATEKALSHNSTLADTEPRWGNVNKRRLPYRAFVWQAPGVDRAKPSTWKYPHHWVRSGGNLTEGRYTTGDMFLHRGGLIAAWGASQGARTGQRAAPAIVAHLNRHRNAIGLGKDEAMQLYEEMMEKEVIKEGEEIPEDAIVFSITKENDELQVVLAEVYVPNRIDTDHETMSAEDVRDMAYEFLATGKIFKIDVQHDMLESGCQVVESFIARPGDPDFVEEAWVLGVKCTDEIWEAVKAGELNGFSFGGTTQKYPAKVLVEVAKQIAGITEKSTVDIIPVHDHTFIVNIANDGSIVSGKTDMVQEHFHLIVRGTATESELDHNHRIVLE